MGPLSGPNLQGWTWLSERESERLVRKENYKKRRKKKYNCFPSQRPILDRKFFKTAMNSTSMYWTVFDVSALWHFLGSKYALQYPLFSAVQRIVKNVPLGMMLSQLKYKFQWKSSSKPIRSFCIYINRKKWISSLGINSCHAHTKTRKPKRPNLKQECTDIHTSADFCQCEWTNTCIRKPIAIKYIVLFPSSAFLIENPQSISTLAVKLTLTYLLSTIPTDTPSFLPYLSVTKQSWSVPRKRREYRAKWTFEHEYM